MGKKVERYSDIINLPHHQSERRPHMPNYNRAAQFAPFSALVGYDQMVQDTAGVRLNEKKKELGEDDKRLLDEKFGVLQKHLKEQQEIEIIYYDDGAGVKGGAYRFVRGELKRIEGYPLKLILNKDVRIVCNNIVDIQGEIFENNILDRERTESGI